MAYTSRPEDFVLGQFGFISEHGYFTCVEVTPTYFYDKELKAYTEKRTGTKAVVVIPEQKYERLTVQLPIGFDEILVPDAKLRFEGFSAKFYRDFNSGEYALSAKADKAIVVK